MIAHLRGRILDKQPNRIVVDVERRRLRRVRAALDVLRSGGAGGEVALRVHTHVREDALALYGFATRLEQELFERLIGVSGIGPKVALAVLSGIEPLDLIRAIERGDLARLTAIPGVGKKTAERIVLELKDRLPRVEVAAAGDAAAAGRRDTAAARRPALGADQPGVSSAARRESASTRRSSGRPSGDFERTLRQALRELAR